MSDRASQIQDAIDLHIETSDSDDDFFARRADLMPELESELQKCRLIRGAMEKASTARISPNNDTPANRHSGVVAPPRIPDYELIRLIGRGGFGQVWLGRNLLDGEYSAVKTFSQHLTSELEGVRLYKTRARNHDGLVPIEHVGSGDGFFYYVMPLADNATELTHVLPSPDHYEPLTLQTLIDRSIASPSVGGEHTGAVSTDEALIIARQIASALGQLHKAGITHCDVKPSNIIKLKGEWRLGDLGLITSSSELTLDRGTEGFWPPEGPGEPAADFYSLGKSLELAVGLSTTQADTVDCRTQTLIRKACHEEPTSRFSTADELLAFLDEIPSKTESRPGSGQATGPGDTDNQPHSRAVSYLLAGAAIVVTLCVAVHLATRHEDDPARDRFGQEDGRRAGNVDGLHEESEEHRTSEIEAISFINDRGETLELTAIERNRSELESVESPPSVRSGDSFLIRLKQRQQAHAVLLFLRPEGHIETLAGQRLHEDGVDDTVEWRVQIPHKTPSSSLFGLAILLSDLPFPNWRTDTTWARHNREIGWHAMTGESCWSLQRVGRGEFTMPRGRIPEPQVGRILRKMPGLHVEDQMHLVILRVDK